MTATCKSHVDHPNACNRIIPAKCSGNHYRHIHVTYKVWAVISTESELVEDGEVLSACHYFLTGI
jgi:hypothetical protein